MYYVSQQSMEYEAYIFNSFQWDFNLKNTVLNVTQPIETVEEKIEVCGYNTECFISLGWMIDATVVELFMNAAQNEI